jgi:hypothetical protein
MKALIIILGYAFVVGVPAWYGHTSWLLAKLAKKYNWKREYILNFIALIACCVWILIVTIYWVIGCVKWK